MGEIEVRCFKCRETLAASDDMLRGYPLINWLIVSHFRNKHGKEISIDKAMDEVIIIEKSP